MNEVNSKRLENYIQEAKKVLLETEMLSYSIKNSSIKSKLSEIVIPNLINFITYLEVKRFDRKEINFYIRQCLDELNEIAEYNKQMMLLTSKYKIIKEDANLIVDLKQ